ncbi:MAG: VCBS repeat-containing protein [Planctomycetes bacterium]|nr:VCBS repeat-containing protein [Planctomycetota bacterium]
MGSVSLALQAAVVLAASTLLSGCGAGLITGIASNQNGGAKAEVRPPELSLPPLLPLVPAANTTRSVIVTNAQIPASARLRVSIEALGRKAEQKSPVALGQGGSTSITFVVDTEDILEEVSDPTASDIEARLAVLVDDQPIAEPVAVVLARQPRARLELEPGQSGLLISPFGQEVVLRVSGLQSVDANNLQMLVETRDPLQSDGSGLPARVTRVCTGLEASATATDGEALVGATVPGNTFPDGAWLFVRDTASGESTSVKVYYRPEITMALPSQGVTTGGNLVTLIGTALVPYDFTQSPSPLQFDAVELSFAKGGRITTLPREDFREQLSAGDRLVFRMPPSPDGRPGQVDIVLRTQLDGVRAEVVANPDYLFSNPHPFFGPRGIVLDQFPVAVAPITLDATTGPESAIDFAVLTEESGVGFLQLLLGQNGMFLRFGARRRIGDREVPAERNPRDLCVADFDGDSIKDLFLVNEGTATAVHHVVLGQAPPAAPLGAVHRVGGSAGMTKGMVGDFDGDGLADLLLVPGPLAPVGTLPQVLLARPTAIGQPAFAAPRPVNLRPFAYEAVEVADLDGDGHLDIAAVDGTSLELDVAFGHGDGDFDAGIPLDFTVSNYTADPNSPAVGLHACGNGPAQSLAIVFAGIALASATTPPTVAVLHQSSRTYAAPTLANVQALPVDPLGVSIVADLDGANSLELVGAIRSDPSPTALASIAMGRFNGVKVEGLPGSVEIGGEKPRHFDSLHFGRAFPSQFGDAKAIFAVHESEIAGERERRLSTLLIYPNGPDPLLLTPDGGADLATPIEAIVGGNWSAEAVAGAGGLRDLAVAHGNAVTLLGNDGFGGFPRAGLELISPGLLPPTVSLVPGPEGAVESLCYLRTDSKFGIWYPAEDAEQRWHRLSGELRAISPNPVLRTAQLRAETQIVIADVDGDGTNDVVAMLLFDVPSPAVDDAMLVLMRGKRTPAATELPFFEPTVATLTHGKATSFSLGDFAQTATGPRVLELAMAIPEAAVPGGADGDHVRFFRYVAGATPEQDHFEASAQPGGPQALQAGSHPMRVAASDFDRDGLVDLLVACDGDDALRLFRNIALPTPAPGEVEVGAFLEALSSPRALAPGRPTVLRLADVNGDGAVDAIVAVESLNLTSERSTALAFYLSEEPGVFGEAEFVSPARLGDRDAALALDVGDWNRDGVLDLFLGWGLAGTNDRNVRVLFGGSR